MLLPIFPSFRPMGMVGEACLPSNAYYPWTPDYTLCSGVHVCWSEHSDSSFVYGFMSLDYGFGIMTLNTHVEPSYYFTGDGYLTVLHARIRNICSNLNNDLFAYHIRDHPSCLCQNSIKNVYHFFFQCSNYTNQRHIFLKQLETVIHWI